jgi:lysozyme family protein
MPDDIQAIQAELDATLADLVNRQNVATDADELNSLSNAIAQVQQQIDLVNQQGLLAAAGAVATAAAALQDTIATARTDPVQQFVDLIDSHLDRLGAAHGVAHAAIAPTPAPAPAAAAGPDATAVSHSVKFAELAAEYSAMFASCVIRPAAASLVQQSVNALRANMSRYASVATHFSNMPWYFVGIIHGMEGSFNFKTHLHNGDPLSARTVHVPAGRPPTGTPPFTWEASAQDALTFENFDRETDFTLPRILYLFEHYNGMGYRQFGLATPYLWSFSNHYAKGKFGQDGRFDPELVSKQAGAATMLKALQAAGETVA